MKPIPFRIALRLRSVRTRLMLWNVLTLACILGLSGGIIQYTTRTYLLASVDNELALRARPMQGMHPPPPFFGAPSSGGRSRGFGGFFGSRRRPERPPARPRTAAEIAREEQERKNVYWPIVLSLEGKNIFPGREEPWDSAAFRRAVKGVRLSTTATVDAEPLRVLSIPLRHEGQIFGVLQVPYPLTDIFRALAEMNRTLLTLIPVALLLAGLGGAALTDRALRPVRHLARKTEQIGAHDLSQRLPVTGEDEFSNLATTFNALLARLETAFVQRERLVQQLERLIEQERRFTADASHELKTPLTIIKANTSLLLGTQPSEAEYREAVVDVDQAADTMSRLVHDLLLLARYDAGQLGRNTRPLALPEVLEAAKRRVRRPDSAPICLALGEPPLLISGNEEEVIRLFTNLLENAARYTPPEGEIRVTAETQGEYIRIYVADTGVGIAPEHLAHLGERFYRVDAARSRPGGGTGLGLSICKGIVAAHGGDLSLESVPGKGTTVTVTLPRLNPFPVPDE